MLPPAEIIHGDCLEVMAGMAEGSVDAIVTDPPYGLEFMGKEWDHGVPGIGTWQAALRVLRPGGYMLAMGGTRTYHRLACAIEDAGFQIRDCLMWVYGSGFPKGKGCLKPAWEPILLARKPGAKVLPLGIDACRVGIGDDRTDGGATGKRKDASEGYSGHWSDSKTGRDRPTAGRWPANVVHDGSEEVLAAFGAFGDDKGAQGQVTVRNADKFSHTYGDFAGTEEDAPFYGDSGSAARFFYCAKASREERSEGLAGMPKRMLRWSSGDESPGTFHSEGTDKYAANFHPTVKPIVLMRWLCKLVTPDCGLVLDPFAGSGSTGVAARMDGFKFVGIEREADFVEIARKRLAAVQPDLFSGIPLSG